MAWRKMFVQKAAFLAAVLLLLPAAAFSAEIEGGLASRLSNSLPGEKFEVLVRFGRAQEAYGQAMPAAGREAARSWRIGRRAAHGRLTEKAMAIIREGGGRVKRSLWSVSIVAAEIDRDSIGKLAALDEVATISPDRKLKRAVAPATTAPATAGYHFDAVNAGALWELGHRGEGTKVAVLDSGVDMHHTAFGGSSWAGLPGGWFDPYGEVPEPSDDPAAHGTKVLSLIVGRSDSFELGLAPEATWMMGRIYDNTGEGSLSAIHAVFQWVIDPDDDPLTDDAPDAASNSWGFEQDPGLCDREFQEDINLLSAAGVLVVFAAGNTGPGAGTDISPANNSKVLSLGATGISGIVSGFSARGPNSCSGAIYPDLVAPGGSVTVADYTSGGLLPSAWETANGTSFAAPIATGAALLLKSAWPDKPMEEIGDALRQSARDTGAPGPDDASGEGMVDVAAAHRLLAGCPDNDGDGYFTGGAECGALDCNDANAGIHPGACDEPKDGVDQDCSGADAASGPSCKSKSGGSSSPFLGGCFLQP